MSIVLACRGLQRYGFMAGSGLFRFSTVCHNIVPWNPITGISVQAANGQPDRDLRVSRG